MKQRNEKYMLDGIVEYDDSYFGKPGKGGKRGRGTSKSKVVMTVSKSKDGKPKYVKMQVVPSLKARPSVRLRNKRFQKVLRYRQTPIPATENHYRKNTCMNMRFLTRISEMVHWLYILIGNAKTFIQGTFHGLGRKHFQRYLDEFCYRFNRRAFGKDVFASLLNATVNAQPLRFSALKELPYYFIIFYLILQLTT